MEILLGIIIASVIFVIVISFYENINYKIDRRIIYDNRIKDNIKLMFFADMHNNCYGKDNDRLIKDIAGFAPDLIVIAGDLFVSKVKEKNENAMNLLRILTKKYKVIFTFGNHESKLRNKEKYKYTIDCIKEFDNNNNLYLLNNKCMTLAVGENVIEFYGYEAELSYFKKRHRKCPKANEIISKFGNKKPTNDIISFMIAHNPDFFEEYAKTGIDYVFSGHNHGGIVRLPLIGGLLSTSFKPFPKYDSGEYVKNNTKMFVTRGLGSHSIRLRFFNMPQIHAYTFMSK